MGPPADPKPMYGSSLRIVDMDRGVAIQLERVAGEVVKILSGVVLSK